MVAGDSARIASHGRGGAGNIGKDDPNRQYTPEDFSTPTLKSDHYTTGRGGTGNMAKNDPNHPELARAAQDIEPPVHRDFEGPHHFGRGGAANVATPTEEEAQLNHEKNKRKSDEAKRRGSNAAGDGKGLVDKGKDFLAKLGKK